MNWTAILGGVLLATVLSGSALAVPIGGTGPIASGAAGPQSTSVCRCSPASLLIPTPAPGVSLAKGDRVNVTYEFEVPNYTAKDLGILVHIPDVFVLFPMTPSGTFTEVVWQLNLTIAGAGWSSPSSTAHGKTVTAATRLSGSSSATLTTEKIAVMADAPHAAFHLDFRWHWTINFAGNGTSLVGGWSAVRTSFHYQAVILPAPLVWRLHTVMTLALGSRFVAPLSGRVANQPQYLIEMEYPGSGDVVAWVHEMPPTGSTTHWSITLDMLSSEDTLSPGAMLVHIHDGFGDIIYSITVHLYTPASATVKFVSNPGSCGPVTFNGTSYANGTTGTYHPGHSYSVHAPATCGSLSFRNYTQLGGGVVVQPVVNGTRMVDVHYNATLLANYS